MYNTDAMSTMAMRRKKMMTIPAAGHESAADKQARLAQVRKTMTKKEFKEYLAKERGTMGSEYRSSVFKDKTKDVKSIRRRDKEACRVW